MKNNDKYYSTASKAFLNFPANSVPFRVSSTTVLFLGPTLGSSVISSLLNYF